MRSGSTPQAAARQPTGLGRILTMLPSCLGARLQRACTYVACTCVLIWSSCVDPLEYAETDFTERRRRQVEGR